MGTTNRELHERVLELERMNRMQAVEIWQLKEERRVLETKVESLLNADLQGPSDREERHTTRRVSFGSVLFSDGEKRGVEAEVDAVEDVEEVEAVTLRELGKAGEKCGLWFSFESSFNVDNIEKHEPYWFPSNLLLTVEMQTLTEVGGRMGSCVSVRRTSRRCSLQPRRISWRVQPRRQT